MNNWGQGKMSSYEDGVMLREISIHSSSTLYEGKITPASTSSNQENKQDPVYARLKRRRIGRKGI